MQLALDFKKVDTNEYQRPLSHNLWQGALNMKKYPIFFSEQQIGHAQIEKQGMFYKIRCFCNINNSQTNRIYIVCGSIKIDLGVCIPMEKGIGLTARMPSDQINIDSASFIMINTSQSKDELFPVKEGVAFDQIHQLHRGRFKLINNEAYISID